MQFRGLAVKAAFETTQMISLVDKLIHAVWADELARAKDSLSKN